LARELFDIKIMELKSRLQSQTRSISFSEGVMLTTCWSPPTTTCDSYLSAAPEIERKVSSLDNYFSYINRVTHDCDPRHESPPSSYSRRIWTFTFVVTILPIFKSNPGWGYIDPFGSSRRLLASESVWLKGGCLLSNSCNVVLCYVWGDWSLWFSPKVQ